MRVVVGFGDESQEFEVADDCLVGSHEGPSGIPELERSGAIAAALARPRDFPPIARMFVPGDRVVIAFDSRLTGAGAILGALVADVNDAIGEEGEITVVATPGGRADLATQVPAGVKFVVHDPADSEQLAYLATTKEGRRVYLNRHLTDADAVIPVGEIAFDPAEGPRVSSSVLFPCLSDQQTLDDYRSSLPGDSRIAQSASPTAWGDESTEVGWLLGAQFSIGLIAGVSGFSEVLAGLSATVEKQGRESLERGWAFQVDSAAELVVAGIGRPGQPTSLQDLVTGMTMASRLVQQGGKLVVLSRAQGEVGPAMRRLIEARETHRGRSLLKGFETAPDYAIALRLSRALDWADVYLLSDLDPQVVEDLGIIPLDKARNATRLVANSRSCLFLSQAELTRGQVVESEESSADA